MLRGTQINPSISMSRRTVTFLDARKSTASRILEFGALVMIPVSQAGSIISSVRPFFLIFSQLKLILWNQHTVVSYQNESFSSKWELPCLSPFSLELWRRERASRQLSFWWKTLILIEHYGIGKFVWFLFQLSFLFKVTQSHWKMVT